MIKIRRKEDCCGCHACAQVCPKQCIVMTYDEEGFLYPKVDESLCIDCGTCERACPWLAAENDKPVIPPPNRVQAYVAKNTDEEERMRSSSGGMFVLLAQQVIERGGVVFGVVYDKEWQLHHVAASTMEDVYPMMGSKYVQSRIENTYNEARKYLREGRQVLFSGTSCQIAGLKTFLNKDYDNLLAVDVICHGAPSPGVWKRYLEEMKYNAACKAAAGKNTVLSSSLKEMPSIEGISFRDKYVSGWKKYCFVVWGSSALWADENSVLSSGKHFENPFMRGFLSNIYLRPSCYACRAKGGACGSDITLADFWGIGNILPEMDDDKGASLVIPHTDKGRIAIEALRHLDIVEVPAEQALRGNPSYFRPVAIPNTRARFYESFMQGASVISLVERLLHVPRWRALSRRIKGLVKRVVKRIIGRK